MNEEQELSRHDGTEVVVEERDLSKSAQLKWKGSRNRAKEASQNTRVEDKPGHVGFGSSTTARKNRSKAQEREVAKEYVKAGFENARRVPGSGAFATLPGDVDPGRLFLAECKETRRGRLTIDPEWLDKVESQSKSMGRPWYALHTWIGSETSRYRKTVTISEDFFYELLKEYHAV
jgi:Holliday junction resolvase